MIKFTAAESGKSFFSFSGEEHAAERVSEECGAIGEIQKIAIQSDECVREKSNTKVSEDYQFATLGEHF